MATMTLLRVPIPPGPAGLLALDAPLQDALLRDGPAFAPIPTVSATVSIEYVTKLLAAVELGGEVHEDAAVVLATSGSTGDPRGVELGVENFRAIGDWAAPGANWVAALPLTSVGGFNVLARARLYDGDVAAVESIGGAQPFTPEVFARAVFSLHDVIATSIVPAQLARLLDDELGVAALQRCDTILVGGGATSLDLQQRAQKFGIALTLTYGMTETAGGCVFNGRPVGDTSVIVEDGRIRIAGSAVALKYRDSDELFDGTFLTNDVGMYSDGVLNVTGRVDDIVSIKGVNVSPVAVEAVLRSMPTIRDAAVVVRNDALHAFIVTASPQAIADAENLVTGQLGRVAVPESFTELDALPHLPNGKIDRVRLREGVK